MAQERAWIVDKTFVPFISTCPECGFLTSVDGAFGWNFCPDCGKDMRIPGPFYVPPRDEWIRQFGTNKQILGYEKKVAKQLAEDGLTEKQIEAALREM